MRALPPLPPENTPKKKRLFLLLHRCMAVLCARTSESARSKTVARLVKDMQGKDDTRKHLGLLVVGELGRQTDLSKVKNLQVRPASG